MNEQLKKMLDQDKERKYGKDLLISRLVGLLFSSSLTPIRFTFYTNRDCVNSLSYMCYISTIRHSCQSLLGTVQNDLIVHPRFTKAISRQVFDTARCEKSIPKIEADIKHLETIAK